MAGTLRRTNDEGAETASMRTSADGPRTSFMTSHSGTTGNDLLIGGAEYDFFDSAGGEDTFQGGADNDRYVVNSAGDVVIEGAGDSGDIIFNYVDYTLPSNVEWLLLRGNALQGFGNNEMNYIIGNEHNNYIDGGAGIDNLSGGAGDDTLVADSPFESLTEYSWGGVDTVIASCNFNLRENFENLQLSESAATQAIGNELNNTLTGNSNNNYMDGGAGADTMTGGAGNDYYIVDSNADSIVETADQGTDYVISSVSFTLSESVENLSVIATGDLNLTGSAGANRLFANDGANRLDGMGGNDVMIGLGGDDTYVVDSAGDIVTEQADGGRDIVETTISYTLGNNVEDIFYLAGDITLTGNSLNNVIKTGSWIATQELSNVLDGGAGADYMIGGQGSDSYYVDNSYDQVSELVNDGDTDLIYASCSFALGGTAVGVENLILTGAGDFQAIGNDQNNQIIGNSGKNYIDGGAGADGMTGGDGDDYYLVDNSFDQIGELVGQGYDTVVASASYALDSNVEALTLTGTATQAVGNALNNTITGNAESNFISGKGGADTLTGGGGMDYFFFVMGETGGEAGGDTIADFNAAEDVLLFHGYGPDREVQQINPNTLLVLVNGGEFSETVNFLTAIDINTMQFHFV